MAKQKGLIKLEGTIGGLNFYYRLGKPTVRAAGGGFNRERILNDPGMEPVRRNNSEFGLCSTTKKVFREALTPFYQYHYDRTQHGRMIKLFQAIKSLDKISERGQRSVAVGIKDEESMRLMKRFAFSPKRRALQLLDAVGDFDPAARTYTFKSFSTGNVQFPANARFVEVLLGILRFDFETLDHELSLGEPVFIGRDEEVTELEVTAPAPIDGPGMQIAFLCVRFYEFVGGKKVVYSGMEQFGLEVVGVV